MAKDVGTVELHRRFLLSTVSFLGMMQGMDAADLADRKARAHEWIMGNPQAAKVLAKRVQDGVDALPPKRGPEFQN